MNEKDTEKMLKELGDKIEINQEHKNELRKAFEVQRKPKPIGFKRYMAAACIALLIFTAAFSLLLAPLNQVQADNIRVQNYRTFIELNSKIDLSVAEHNGVMYIPNIEQGIYKHDGKEQTKIYSGRVSLVKISPDGKRLAFYQEGAIGILDLTTLESRLVLVSDSKIAYETPAWFGNNAILATKIMIQDINAAGVEFAPEIIKLEFKDMKQIRLTEGSYPSYVENKNALLYQKGDFITILDLDNNKEKIIDQGMHPAVSPDGKAIAYTKLSIMYEEISEKVKIEKVLQNIWVADGRDYDRKTMITTNIILEDIDKEEWLKNLQPSEELQMLSLSGRYSYQFPAWSKDSKVLYALRRDFTNNRAVVVKIELGKEPQDAKTVVERYLQSIMLKDEDYQSGLTAVQSKALDELKQRTITSYKVFNEGNEKSTAFIDVELKFASNGSSAESARLRFFLNDETGQYYIVDMKELK